MAVIGAASFLAFVFLTPVIQLTFARPPLTEACSDSAGQLSSLCGHINVQGYASITYWLSGTGGFYGTLPSSGYILTP